MRKTKSTPKRVAIFADVPSELRQRAKARAAEEGRYVRDLVEDALRTYLAHPKRARKAS